MASRGDVEIDLRGDGRAIFDKRDSLKDPVGQARVHVPNSTGYKNITTTTSDQCKIEHFALRS
jgi:hypothetical protein